MDTFFTIHQIFFVVFLIFFIIMAYRVFNYTETDKHGRRYRRPLFYPGRICPGCGLKVITRIPSCPSCGRDFSQNSEDSNIQHKDNF